MALDATVQLPGGVSPKAVELFESVRAEVPVEAPPAPVLVPTVPVEPTPVPSAEVVEPASGRPLRAWVGPLVFAGAAAVGAGLGTYFGMQARSFEASSNGARFALLAEQQAALARQSAFGANVAWTSAAVALAAAVVWFALERF